jgi:hypothetical protein
VLQPDIMVPTNGIGVGVGTGPPGEGIMSMCVSVAVILSPCFAAGLPTNTHPYVDCCPAPHSLQNFATIGITA